MRSAPLRVAVVEDDAPSRAALGRVLRAAGFEAALFDSGEAFVASPPDPSLLCLILDIHLTGMSGTDLQTRLRDAGSAVPVIITTANDEEAVRTRAERCGCVAFLRKPFDSATLLRVIASISREPRD